LCFIALPTSYLAEFFCIWVTYLPSKIRTRLDFVKKDDHSLSLATLQPVIKKNLQLLIRLKEHIEYNASY
jgi:hypothetical protein